MAEYEAGIYDRAAQSFAGENTADNFYNLGNALALQGDLQGAINAYEESLALQPDAEDALSNRDFLQSLLDQEEQQQDQEGDPQNQEGDPSEDNNESESEGDTLIESSDQGEQQPDSDSNSEQSEDGQNEQTG